MTDRDTRPLMSPMPQYMQPVYDAQAPRAIALAFDTFHAVLAAGGGRLAPEVENDALSLACQMAATVALGTTLHLADTKKVPIEVAAAIVFEDLQRRYRSAVDLAVTARDHRSATKQ